MTAYFVQGMEGNLISLPVVHTNLKYNGCSGKAKKKGNGRLVSGDDREHGLLLAIINKYCGSEQLHGRHDVDYDITCFDQIRSVFHECNNNTKGVEGQLYDEAHADTCSKWN